MATYNGNLKGEQPAASPHCPPASPANPSLSCSSAELRMNAAVAYFYNAKNTFKLTVNSTIFEKDGWVAPKRIYGATFNPADGWSNKSKGLVYIQYEDEKGRMKSDTSCPNPAHKTAKVTHLSKPYSGL